MVQATGFWKNLWRDESGQDLLEYCLIACCLALGSVATLKGVATNVGSLFTSIGTTLTTAL